MDQFRQLRQLRSLFNNPSFWRGAQVGRGTEDGTSPDSITRIAFLLDAAEGGLDVTSLPEFARWLGYDPQRPFYRVKHEDLDLRGLIK